MARPEMQFETALRLENMLHSRHHVITVIPRWQHLTFNSVLFTSSDWGWTCNRVKELLAAVKHITLHLYATTKYCRTQKACQRADFIKKPLGNNTEYVKHVKTQETQQAYRWEQKMNEWINK